MLDPPSETNTPSYTTPGYFSFLTDPPPHTTPRYIDLLGMFSKMIKGIAALTESFEIIFFRGQLFGIKLLRSNHSDHLVYSNFRGF